MRRDNAFVLAIALLAVPVLTRLPSATAEEKVDIWAAAATGDLDAIQQQLADGQNINAKAPSVGLTPLMAAAITGHSDAARLLLDKGAKPNLKSEKDGAAALHMAAFFGHIDIVQLLLDKGADVNIRNAQQESPLDVVSGQWSDELAGLYNTLGAVLKLQLDLQEIKAVRPKIAALLAAKGGESGKEEVKPTGYRGSYFKNGEIYVNEYGTPEGKPLTSGHQDFKPSWSKTGDMLVFFRRLKDDPVVTNWKTAIHVINVDGSGLHALSDGTHTDFNQTWARDGTNTPIWNRKHPEKVSFYVMASKVGNHPGQEIALTDKSYHTWAYSCLIDGRILVQCAAPDARLGIFPDDAPSGRRAQLPADRMRTGDPRHSRSHKHLAQ